MLARNTHSAMVAGVAPREVGEVDEARSGVRVALAAGLLVPVETAEPSGASSPEKAAPKAPKAKAAKVEG